MISRRRLIGISAAAIACPKAALTETRWTGRALGARVQVTLRAQDDLAPHIVRAIKRELRKAERLFSLYDPDSALSRLNREGRLDAPPAEFLDLCARATRIHRLSAGRFDPTIQPLWKAHATGTDIKAARATIGWNRVRCTGLSVRLGTGQRLTFNGIAQGYATDRITMLLRQFGLRGILVNIGEFRALGGPWRLALEDPTAGTVTTLGLFDSAVATSSPSALRLGSEAHILDPIGIGLPHWGTVSVCAADATLADGASTAFCLMDRQDIETVVTAHSAIHEVHLISRDGNYRRLGRGMPRQG